MKKILILLFALLLLTSSAHATVWPRKSGSKYAHLANGGTVTGTIKVPVIFVSFQQTTTNDDSNVISTDNQNSWMADLNASSNYGANQYFHDMSYGNVNVEFIKVGTYTATKKASDWSGDNRITLAQNTIKNVTYTSGVDKNSWANFDSNDDGIVDAVLIVFAGHANGDYNSSGQAITTINPHSHIFDSDSGSGSELVTGISKKFSRYVLINDLGHNKATRASLGTALHELGHGIFDLPDYYGGSYVSYMGFWDCMDYGTFFGDVVKSQNPVPGLSAFSRMLNGWLTPKELTYGQHVKLNPLNNFAEACMIKDTDSHYYILEARYNTSGTSVSWDNGLGSGLILTEVDESDGGNWIVAHGTNDGRVKVRPANNVTFGTGNYNDRLSTQPFGTNNVTEISESFGSIFNTKTVTNIKVNTDGTVEFDFMGGNTNECHLQFASPSVDMTVGDTQTNALNGVPDGYDGNITYSSSNNNVVTVNATTGAVTAVGAGTATITVTATSTSKFVGGTATYNVLVREVAQNINNLTDGTIVMVNNYYGLGNLVNDNGTVKALGGSQAAVDAVFPGYGYNTAYANGFDKTNDNHLWKVTTVGGKKYLVNVGSNQYLSVANPTVLTSTTTAATFTAVSGLSNVYAISTTNGQYMSASVFTQKETNYVTNHTFDGNTWVVANIKDYTPDQTLRISADLSTCGKTEQNILSLGNNIAEWDGAHVHMFYTNGSLKVWFMNNDDSGGQPATQTINSNTLTVELHNNTLTVNGTPYTTSSYSQLAGLTDLSTIEVGLSQKESAKISKAKNYNISVISGEDSQYPVSAITTQDASTAWAFHTVSTVVDDRTAVTASFAETSATVTEGETFTQTVTTNCPTATVSYASSNTGIATVNANGVVSGVKKGTATITATVTAPADDANYKGTATASYTITVNEATVDPDPEDPDEPEDPTDGAVVYKKVNGASDIVAGETYIVFNHAGWTAAEYDTESYMFVSHNLSVVDDMYIGGVNENGKPTEFVFEDAGDGKFYVKDVATGNHLYLYPYRPGQTTYYYPAEGTLNKSNADYKWSVKDNDGSIEMTVGSTYYMDVESYTDGTVFYTLNTTGTNAPLYFYKKIILGGVKEVVAMSPKQKEETTTVKKTAYEPSTSTVARGSDIEFLILSDNMWKALGTNATGVVDVQDGEYGHYPAEIVNSDGKASSFKLTSQGFLYNVRLKKYVNAGPSEIKYENNGKTQWTLTGSGSNCVLKQGGKSLTSPTTGGFTLSNGDNKISIFTSFVREVQTTTYVDADPLAITIGATEGYGTYYNADEAYMMPNGLTGYFIEDAQREGSLTLTERYSEGSIVPAGTALLIKGQYAPQNSPHKATIYTTAEKGGTKCAYIHNDATSNQLEGTRTSDGMTASSRSNVYYYKLAYHDEADGTRTLGFYWGANGGAAFKMNNPNTAYLAVDKETAASLGAKGFVLPTDLDDEETAIKAVGIEENTSDSNAIYNIAGQRVDESYRGIIIKNGKKYLNK